MINPVKKLNPKNKNKKQKPTCAVTNKQVSNLYKTIDDITNSDKYEDFFETKEGQNFIIQLEKLADSYVEMVETDEFKSLTKSSNVKQLGKQVDDIMKNVEKVIEPLHEVELPQKKEAFDMINNTNYQLYLLILIFLLTIYLMTKK